VLTIDIFVFILVIICIVWQEFYWQPVVNESMLDVYRGWLSMKSEERPKLVITGSATVSLIMCRIADSQTAASTQLRIVT